MPVLALPVWLVAALLAVGLWLATRLYLRAPRRPGLALAAAGAWLLLALLLADPRLDREDGAWLPPRVLFVVDDCPGYAALGARDSADIAVQDARRHYAARGFRVDVRSFSACGTDAAGGLHAYAGMAGLRKVVREGSAAPNLQGILLWSDGRFFDDASGNDADAAQVVEQAGAWPAPLHAVRVRSAPVAAGEAQGETIRVESGNDGPVVVVEWRGGGEGAARPARLDWIDTADGRALSVWRAALEPGPGARAGERIVTRLAPTAGARALVERGTGVALVRGPDDATPRNDTVAVAVRRSDGPFHHVVLPVVSLDERAFLDALSAPSSRAAGDAASTAPIRVTSPDSLRPRAGDVVWIRAGRTDADAVSRRARAAGAVAVRYSVHDHPAAAPTPAAALPAHARPEYAEAGRAFLPAAALRLADIGLAVTASDTVRLRADDGSVEPLAWAEHAGRRGLLLWRETGGGFGTILTPRWNAVFRGTPSESATARAWARGIAGWARLQGAVQVDAPARVLAGRSFRVLARVPGGAADALRLVVADVEASGVSVGAGWARFEAPALPPGVHPLAVHAAETQGAEVASRTHRWSGTIRAVAPVDAAHARLLRDAELLDALARAGGGAVHASDAAAWPALPEGQVRASPAGAQRMLPVLPATLALCLLLVCVWAWRRRARLD